MKERKKVPWYGYGFGLLFSTGLILYLWKENPTAKSTIFIISLAMVLVYLILFSVAKLKKMLDFGIFLIFLSMKKSFFGTIFTLLSSVFYVNVKMFSKS